MSTKSKINVIDADGILFHDLPSGQTVEFVASRRIAGKGITVEMTFDTFLKIAGRIRAQMQKARDRKESFCTMFDKAVFDGQQVIDDHRGGDPLEI